ncbi:MAG: vWA domain-containing protein [Thermacetogeniaceae bacterium]
MENTFEYNFIRFIHLLRQTGIKVSTEEVITAAKALETIDILNKKHFKLALSATIIKNPDEQPIFELAFDRFFAEPEVRQQQRREWEERKSEELRLIEEAEHDLAYEGESLSLTDEEKLLYAQLPKEEKEKIKRYLEASKLPADRDHLFRPMLEYQIRGTLRYWKQRLEETDEYLDYFPKRDDELASIISKAEEESSNILYEDMKKIRERDLPRFTNILKSLSRKLATKISRRYRTSKKKVKIDLRRSIKSNVRYGGILFKLRYKQKRVQKPNILLICDVSGSMARYAAFVIQFIYGLSSAARNIESFIFSEDLERITPHFAKIRPFEEIMSEVIGKSKIWGKGTNFHKSLITLKERYPHLLNSNTVVIILSDTKTLEIEQSATELSKLKAIVKEVIWLNTLPLKEWKDLQSVTAFQRHCKMYECYTLAHLEKIVRKQFLKGA